MVESTQKSSSFQNPIAWRPIGRAVNRNNKVGTLSSGAQSPSSHRSLIQWHLIECRVLFVVVSRSKYNNGGESVSLSRNAVFKGIRIDISPAAVYKKSMDVHCLALLPFAHVLDIFHLITRKHFILKVQQIDWDFEHSCISLECRCQKTLREEKAGDPVADWLSTCDPFS